MVGTPAMFAADGMNVVYAGKLTACSGVTSSLSQTKAVVGGKEYLLWDKVKVFRYLSGQGYQEMSLNDAISNLTDYKISCYYDKAESLGGRIRVIIAE